MDREILHIIDAIKSAERTTWAFDMIIERYSEQLYWHIRRIVVVREESEDVLQDTFVRAFMQAQSFRGRSEGELVAWLYKIATTMAIKSLKRRRRTIFTSVDSLAGELIADFESQVALDADSVAIRLQRAVIALPMKQKLVFNMRYYDNMSFGDISKATGQSISTLKTNYHYAVKHIKESVQEVDYE